MKNAKVFTNAKWIIICKIIQSVLQLLVGMLSARYLGPSNYGLINYAASITAFAMPIMKMGLDATLVFELVKNPKQEGRVLGTSLGMNVISSFLSIIGVSFFAYLANPDDRQTLIVCVVYSLSVFFAALEMIEYWFQYKLLSKYSSVVMLISYVAVSAYKIFLLVTQKNVVWFAFSHSIEYGLIAFCLILLYFRKSGDKLVFSFSLAKDMFYKSKYYIFASILVVVFQNIDKLLLTELSGTESTGYYSAAVTCTVITQFVFTAIIDSFRPEILKQKKEDEKEYETSLISLYSIVIYLSLLQSVAFTVFAKPIVYVMYGKDFMPTVKILQILVWYFTFSIIGTVRNVWILAEDKQKYLWGINLMGAAFSAILNFILIPHFDAIGAAIASFFTQLFTNFILGFILRPLRPNNRLILKSLNPKIFFANISSIVKMLLKRQ